MYYQDLIKDVTLGNSSCEATTIDVIFCGVILRGYKLELKPAFKFKKMSLICMPILDMIAGIRPFASDCFVPRTCNTSLKLVFNNFLFLNFTFLYMTSL